MFFKKRFYDVDNNQIPLQSNSDVVIIGETKPSVHWLWYLLLMLIFFPLAVILFLYHILTTQYILKIDNKRYIVSKATMKDIMKGV